MKKNNLVDRPTSFFQQLWPCLKGEEIAKCPELQSICQELKSLISAPAELYATLYETTLFRFMEFCQAMPQDMNQPKPYSLLTNALETAVVALKVRRGTMLPRHSNSETIAEQEPLWTYAIFTASLWVQLPDLQSDRTIELYKNEQEKIGTWHPLAGNLYEPQTFYNVLPEPHLIIVDSTICLVGGLGRIIPAVAYRWLTSDKKMWSSWWEVMTHSISTHNELAQIIQKALPQNKLTNAEKISVIDTRNQPIRTHSIANETVVEKKSKQSESEAPLKLEPSSEEMNVLTDIQEWILYHCSATGKLNGKKLFARIPSGLLIRESSLKTFIKGNSEYKSVDVVLKLLEYFLKQESQSVIVNYPFIHDDQEKMIPGIILKIEYLCESLKDYPENQWIENL